MVDEFTPRFREFMNELSNISNQGSYTPAPKLKPVKPASINLSMPGLPGGVSSRGGGSSELSRLIRAIRSQESNDNYGAVNPDSGAAGAYQIMPFNIQGSGGWDKEALGRNVSMNQFMGSRSIQDAIARYKLNQYLNRYGAAGAAVAWYGGPGAVSNMHSRKTQTGGYPSLYAYWNAILRRMGNG